MCLSLQVIKSTVQLVGRAGQREQHAKTADGGPPGDGVNGGEEERVLEKPATRPLRLAQTVPLPAARGPRRPGHPQPRAHPLAAQGHGVQFGELNRQQFSIFGSESKKSGTLELI